MTLVEVVVSLSLAGILMAAIINGYYAATVQAEKSAMFLAANSAAIQAIEATRCAAWDTTILVDELVSTNFPDKIVTLDRLTLNSTVVYATNKTTITQVSTSPPLRRIQVDCIWSWRGIRRYTNTIATCRSPGQ